MLELKNIIKDYPAGDNTVHALKGVSLQFRESEFVAILGPSGCGKTTMLNIVGGLDQYTDGDLVINGTSTKNFADRDWDGYRNHSIGFVFQSYNLIPHQTVLQNVELALTLSGVSKSERKQRALQALTDVGLGDQAKKRPSQLSGGQMQRVAIARALVNNPDIILADEPTGALDTETSIQVMDILKEVAKDRLVIMVTHNPDLAETYATRIIRMLDGVIVSDSAPLTEEEVKGYRTADNAKKQATKGKKTRKPSMSLWTSFGLSLKNLISKKGRTMLTSFAGSIGIIGIALIYAVSQGMTTYIDMVQEDTLSSYPLTLEATHTDMGSLLTTFIGQATSHGTHDKDAVYQKSMLYDLVNSLNNMNSNENDLKAFKKYLEERMADTSENNELRQAINGIQYGYDLELMVYTKNVDGKILRSDTQQLLMDLMIKHLGVDMSGMLSMSESYGFSSNMMTMGATNLWQEMLPGTSGELINPLILNQYEIIDGGRWPAAYNEIVLVVDKNNEIDDMTLYALGLKSEEEMDALANAALGQENIEVEGKRWTYEEIRAMEFKVVLPFNCYSYNEKTGLYEDIRVNEDGTENVLGLEALYTNALPLKVTGIIRAKEDASSTMLSGNIVYTSALTAHIIQQGQNAPVVQAQLANPDVDVTTGLPFKPTTNAITAEEFGAYLATLEDETKKQMWVAYISVISDEELAQQVAPLMEGKTADQMRAMLNMMFAQDPQSAAYVAGLDDAGVTDLYRSIQEQMVSTQYAAGKRMEYAQKPAADVAAELMAAYADMTDEQRMDLYKTAEFLLYVSKLDEIGKANTYVDILVADRMEQLVEQIKSMTKDELVAFIQNLLSSGNLEIPGDYQQYVEQLLQKDEASLKETCVTLIKSDAMQTEKTTRAEILQSLAAQGMASTAAQAAALNQMIGTYTVDQFINYYDNVLEFSETTYEDNLVTLGKLDLESPDSISIYASSFENKDIIEAAIAEYNKDKDELDRIVYTDYVGLMMSSVTTIIDAITYVLIAFVSISLIVSSIMIGVITLISVQERTKEIGILRAIGASKKNVSTMFNVETVMIGFAAGAIGVLVTYLLCIPINAILHALTGINNLSAILPVEVALILVGISMLLTVFAGIIPSRSAAKKDPVVALRTE